MRATAQNLAELSPRAIAAEDALAAITLDHDDITVANTAADWLLTRHLPTWRFSVLIDEGETFRLPFDWKRKNVFGIKTDDAARARTWITAALLAGHHPMVWVGRRFAHGCGSIAGIRRNIVEGSHVFSPSSPASCRKVAEVEALM